MILTEETVPKYLSDRSDLIKIFSPNSTLKAKCILGGNVNYAFQVIEEGTNKSLFVKQAPEFVAIFGPGALPLTSKRMQREINIYNEWESILGSELSSRFLPKIHLFDEQNMVFVMDFLDNFDLLDHDLVQNVMVSEAIASSLGQFMGKTHAASHSTKITKDKVSSYVKDFENREMRDIQLAYVFTKCYKEATEEQKAGLKVDDAFMKEIDALKLSYNGGNSDNLCLCHGDLHPGSVMVRCETDEVKIIDPEFTVYGPPALDVGSLLSGFVLAAVHQTFCDNSDAVDRICACASTIWTSYKKCMEEGGISDHTLSIIEAETVGFAVAEVCRTALEFAGGRKWLQFDDLEVKRNSRKAALTIVENCMIHRHTGGMDLLLREMKSVVKI